MPAADTHEPKSWSPTSWRLAGLWVWVGCRFSDFLGAVWAPPPSLVLAPGDGRATRVVDPKRAWVRAQFFVVCPMLAQEPLQTRGWGCPRAAVCVAPGCVVQVGQRRPSHSSVEYRDALGLSPSIGRKLLNFDCSAVDRSCA